MAKKNKGNILVRLVSSGKKNVTLLPKGKKNRETKEIEKRTGYFLVKKRSVKGKKLSFRKYDPVLRKHVLFNEEKIK